MKKVLYAILVFLVIGGAINGVNSGGGRESEELSAFKNIALCQGHTLGSFLESFAQPGTLKWQDELVNPYGWVVGFIAGLPMKDPDQEGFIGMQFNYQESPFSEGMYDFTPVAFEMKNVTTGQGSALPQESAFTMLQQMCEEHVEDQALAG